MRAVLLHELGGPERLVLEEVPTPAPAAGEVLVRIRAAALNHRDLFVTRGLYPKIALPALLGSDGAGEVAALGDGVTSLHPGSDVVIYPMLDWGDDPALRSPASSILGMPRAGTFAQYVCVPALNVYPKPAHLSFEEAAAIPLGGLTAYRALFTRGKLARGETVLIPGAGGGVQTFVLLFAKQAGARVIATSSSEEKLERARALGADLVLNYAENSSWEKDVRAAGPVDLVVDSSGGETFSKALSVVRPGGRVVLYGGTHPEANVKLFALFWNELSVLGSTMGSPQDFGAMLALLEDGLKPAVDRVFSMTQIVAAMRRMDDASQFGKIVLSW
ncbi:MAG TPA: zinc-binding dehydrogenase [Candidatus Dormibacteraeota bacterium]|nr:zinc-binding dehydrogenase [Candidatus Dormibacteraeota bacterium]